MVLCFQLIYKVSVAASAVTDTHTMTTVTLVRAPRVNKSMDYFGTLLEIAHFLAASLDAI